MLIQKKEKGKDMGNFNEDKVRLMDIANNIREIDSYVSGADFETFSHREDMREAVISQMQQIGGAAALLSDEFKEKYGEIDWDTLKGFQYANFDQTLELDLHPIWHIISEDLPEIIDPILDLATIMEDEEDLHEETLNEEDFKDVQEIQFKKELEIRENADIKTEDEMPEIPPRSSGMNYIIEKERQPSRRPRLQNRRIKKGKEQQ